MPDQLELFKNKITVSKDRTKKNKNEKQAFSLSIDGHGVEDIEKTKTIHLCFACKREIAIGSKVEKRTPIVNEKPLWYQASYRHIKPPCLKSSF